MENEPSFLAGLLKEQANLKRLAEETPINVKAVVAEIDRQIRQPVQDNGPLNEVDVIEPGIED